MLLPLLIFAACQPGVTDLTLAGGTFDGLARYDGGLGLAEGPSASPPDAGIAFQPGSRFGFYKSPVLDAGFLTRWIAFTWSMSSPAGLPLANDAGRENFRDYNIDMRGNVALFHFDEPSWSGASAEVRDSSGQGNHGTVDAGASTVPNGLFGRAGNFDGVDDCVMVPDSPTLNPTSALTLSVWFYPRTPNGSPQGLISKRIDYTQPSAYTLFLWLGGTLWFDLDTENDRTTGAIVIEPAQWHHAALVYDGTQLPMVRASLYVDGVKDLGGLETSASLPPNLAQLAIGCLPNPNPNPSQAFDGLLDEAALWQRALSPAEIKALVSRGTSRLLFQVRACDDGTCSTNPRWVGPGNTPDTFFTGLGGPLSLADSQFVQYRVWMQNDVELQRVDFQGVEAVPGACLAALDGGSDAGTPDSGTASDAGTTSDAGTSSDAGRPDARALQVGCGCGASEGLALVLLLLLARRRDNRSF